MQRSNRWIVVVVLILAALQLSACTRTPAAKTKIQPAQVEPIEGTDLKRVTLTEKAAERLAIQTAPVREEPVVRNRIVGGEVVGLPAASANVEVADPSTVWVRVPLSESDLNQVDRSQPARVLPLDDEEDSDDETAGWTAEADEGPADDDPEEATSALYFVVNRAEHGLAPGQPVLVELTLAGSGTQRKIVPYAAVIYDVKGGTWVYTNPEPLVFVRQPVSVDYIEDDLAVLSEGPPAGTAVVTVGGALLYGAETGVSK